MEFLLRKGIEKLEKYNQQQQQQRQQQNGQPQYGQQPQYYGQQPPQYGQQQPALYYQQPAQVAQSPVSPNQQWLSPQQTGQQYMPQTQYQPPPSPSLHHVQSAPPPLPPRSAPPPATGGARPALPHIMSAPPVQQTPQLNYWQQEEHSDDQALALALSQSMQISARPTSTNLQPYQAPPAQVPAPYAPPLSIPSPRAAAPPRPQAATPSVMRVNQTGKTQIRKILCLDGGGVRGLASLMIVKNLMERLEAQRGGKLEPWQEFDLIGGTSTGGLIAIMLGRLRMSVDQCIKAYVTMSKHIFEPVHSKANLPGRAIAKFQAEGKFNSQALEDQVRQILVQHGFKADEMLNDQHPDAPKVFVTAVQAINTDSVVLRTYKHPDAWDPVSGKAQIWQAARATSAASTFFDPITIGNIRYIDGALQDNNPVFKADEESRAIWGEHSDRLIISVGTGEAPGPSFVGNAFKLVDALAKLVTSCKKDDERYQRGHRDAVDNGRFYRFNVTHGLAEVGLEEWDALEQIEASTNSYLSAEAVFRSFRQCASTMHEAGQRLGYIAGAELQTHLRVQEMASVYCEFCEDCHKGVHYSEAMFLCLSSGCHMLLCGSCHSTHENEHMKTMIRFKPIQWMERMPEGLRSTAPCSHCAKDAKARWECEACQEGLCKRCVSDFDRRLAFFKEHHESSPNHRHFKAIYPPEWRVNERWAQDPCPCQHVEAATSLHCDRCHSMFLLNSSFYWCRDCMVEFGSDLGLCPKCYEEDAEHRQIHEWGVVTISFVGGVISDNLQDVLKKMWRCQQCPEVIPDGRYWLHKHSYLTLAVDTVLAEHLRRNKFFNCNRREWKSGLIEPDDPIKDWRCGYCVKQMAYEPQMGQRQSSFCVECMDCFCPECTAANRCGHRHQLLRGPIRRPPKDYGNVTCNLCSASTMLAMWSGLWCSDCKNFMCCGNCYDKLRRSGGKDPPQGLRHTKILQDCKTKSGWVLYLNK